MTYSCGFYKSPNDSLYESQLNKVRLLIAKANVKPTDSVLEIGFGWGFLSRTLVKEVGCKVTGVTLSTEQKKWSEDAATREGISDKINYLLQDYRLLGGKFDKIISCEMLEAVGLEYLPVFFQCCDRLLEDNGKLVVQVITTPEERYDVYKKSTDFIQTYIFPGSHCPSHQAITDSLKSTKLIEIGCEDIGIHYAKTLENWKENFVENAENVRKIGFDDNFIRKWEYYFSYCEAGFATKTLGDLQLVYEKKQ